RLRVQSRVETRPTRPTGIPARTQRSGRYAGMPVCRLAGMPVGRLAGWPVGRLAGWPESHLRHQPQKVISAAYVVRVDVEVDWVVRLRSRGHLVQHVVDAQCDAAIEALQVIAEL